MKRALLGAAAAFAIIAPVAAQADETVGHVGANYTNFEFDGGSDIDMLDINGAFATDVGGGTLMFDAASANADFGGGDAGLGYVGLHYGWSGGDHYFGFWGGFTDLVGVSGMGGGLEGQWNMDQFTLNASGSFTNFDTGGGDADYTHLAADGTIFLTPNFGATLNVAWGDFDDEDFTAFGASAGWRPDGTDWTFNFGYERGDTDFGDVDAWRIGLTWDFGSMSLQDQSQNGASRNGASSNFRHVFFGF